MVVSSGIEGCGFHVDLWCFCFCSGSNRLKLNYCSFHKLFQFFFFAVVGKKKQNETKQDSRYQLFCYILPLHETFCMKRSCCLLRIRTSFQCINLMFLCFEMDINF